MTDVKNKKQKTTENLVRLGKVPLCSAVFHVPCLTCNLVLSVRGILHSWVNRAVIPIIARKDRTVLFTQATCAWQFLICV